MAVIWASRAVSGLRLEADDKRRSNNDKAKKNDYVVGGGDPNGSVPRLSLNKPSWVVKTEACFFGWNR